MSDSSHPGGFPLAMVREHLENLPEAPLPREYSLRWYQSGDETHWLEIHLQADRLNRLTPQLFREQFGFDEAQLAQRQCYLAGPGGRPVGTGTAWFKEDFEGGAWGRVHWMALLPEHHGRGLGKTLLGVVCRRLRELGHRRAYLTTSSLRVPAIRLYRRFGFEPLIRSPQEEAAWSRLASQWQR